MATTLYLRNIASIYTPTAGSKSAVLPTGTDNSLSVDDDKSMLTTAGTTDTTITINSLAQTGAQSGRFARFTSERLATQTVSANTWTVAYRVRESNANANAFLALSLYVWRPSTSSVVGFIYDNTAAIGAEWTNTAATNTNTFSGSSVSIAALDVLVCEVWYTATQAKATSYTDEFSFDLSSYVETPQNLAFFIDVPERRWSWIIE